mmetsp:Transcript_36373/g.48134  ORF Transcript_36373/g.48134 Transcript_36373/m.48134 type:complete len:262 (-) Transcript_36373:341-1126(-)
MCVYSSLVVAVTIGDLGVNADFSVLLVVHGADLESILVTTDKTRLLTSIARGSSAHDRGLHECACTTVGVRTILGVNRGEGDGILVVLSKMEMSREPGLDTTVLAYELDELTALEIVGVVEPAASIDNVVLLEDTETRSVGGCVGEDEDLPSLRGGVGLESFLKPCHLSIVNSDLVRGVLSVTEDGGGHTHEKSLICNKTRELRSGLAMLTKEHLKILLISFELIKSLKIVVSSNNFVWYTEGAEVTCCELVTFRCSSKQL